MDKKKILGLLVVSCEHGGIRQSPNGVYVYDDEGLREEPLGDEASSYSPAPTGRLIKKTGRIKLMT